MAKKIWWCLTQVIAIIGFAGCAWFYLVPVEVLVIGDIYSEYVSGGYAGNANVDDLLMYLFSAGLLGIVIVFATICLRNIICALGGVIIGALMLYYNFPYGLKHPQLFNMFGS